tara:strand:+ start:892 stop:1293 length:402 start_codon:yes stop_codon:yes gene_type:complete
MKYLNDYTEQAQTNLFKQRKVFFAFSNEQFIEGMKKHFLTKQDQITGLGSGMYCPRNQAKKVLKELNKIYTNAIKQDIAENGIERIIKRELLNHECHYTGDPTACIEKLKDYPNITEDLINKIFYKKQRKYYE